MASSHREVDRDEERTYRRQERSPRDESHPRRVRNSRSRSPAARLDSRRQLIRSPSPDENPSRPVRLRRSDYEIEDTENNRPRDRVKYRRLQAHSNDQEKRIRQLEGRLSDISNADLDPAERRRVQRENERQLASDAEEEDGDRNSSAEDDVSQPTEVVQRGAQLFFLTHSPWLCQEGSAFKADKDLRYTPDQRFKNKFTRVQGQRADLQEVLSNVWTGNKAAPAWVIRTFNTRYGAQCSNTSSRLRNQCAILFDVAEKDLKSPLARYEKFKERIGYKVNGAQSFYSSWAVPILHEDESEEFDIDKVLLNPVLMRVHAAITRGPNRAKALVHAAFSEASSGDNLGHILGLGHITPGAIATCAVLARWALSKDHMLQSRGEQTRIDYMADYELYLQFLLDGIASDSAPVKNIIRTWDSVLYPGSDSTIVGPAPGAGGASSEHNAVLAAMLAAPKESELQEGQEQDGDEPQNEHEVGE